MRFRWPLGAPRRSHLSARTSLDADAPAVTVRPPASTRRPARRRSPPLLSVGWRRSRIENPESRWRSVIARASSDALFWLS
ncbi:MAG: hypothetical protein ACF8PN_06155 [Phycisphaerales bacterium]